MAFEVFHATRREIEATQSAEASERLYVLAALLTNKFALKGDHARVRALLETALDSVVLQSHRNCLRAMLSRNALREGDVASAEQWLAGCDPRAEDLRSDSDYRVARALLDTVRGDFASVLTVLGRSRDEIPIDPALEATATTLRANALEKTGEIQRAATLLREFAAFPNVLWRLHLETVRRAYAPFELCAQALPLAFPRPTRPMRYSMLQNADGAVGCFLVAVGGLVAAYAVLVWISTTFDGLLEQMPGAGRALVSMLPATDRGAPTWVEVVVVSAVSFGIGVPSIVRVLRDAFIRRYSTRITGNIETVLPTIMTIILIFKHPVVQVRVNYQGSDGPQRGETRIVYTPELQAVLMPGLPVPIRVHPRWPGRVVFDL